jgi:hypothetical protein
MKSVLALAAKIRVVPILLKNASLKYHSCAVQRIIFEFRPKLEFFNRTRPLSPFLEFAASDTLGSKETFAAS